MSSFCLSALSSLDSSLALLRESLEKLKAARSVDIVEVIEQLKATAEHARIVRELVWSEMPEASWKTREELDALIDKIQKVLTARNIQQLRNRLLSLAGELERGTIVHRRAHRVNELTQLRDLAVKELRSQAEAKEEPLTLPGPQAGQWIAWACALQEPQDTESLEALRDGFAHLDDLVANLEPSMWVAGPPAPEPAPEPVAASGPVSAARAAMETPSRKPPLAPPAVHSAVLGLPEAVASLDAALAPLVESLEILKAARPVDSAEVIGELKMAADQARGVRELVWAELPQASWQSRQELDGLVDKIQKTLAARALAQQRSRLLALATELESGAIVHRRSHRVDELKQLRELAVTELRSQAALEGAPPTLPGPDAAHWVTWVCGLEEPQDADSLQALRDGYPRLDDFVANLEPSMWVPAGAPPKPAPPEKPAAKAPSEPPKQETRAFAQAAAAAAPARVDLDAGRVSVTPGQQRIPDVGNQPPPRILESNTLTPNDTTPARSDEELERIQAQERALLAGMMGLVSDPVNHFNRPVEMPFTGELYRDTGPASATVVSEPVERRSRPAEPPESFRATNVASVAVITDPIEHFERPAAPAFTDENFLESKATAVGVVSADTIDFPAPAERCVDAEVFRETIIAPSGLVSDEAGHFSPAAEPPLKTRILHETSAAASAITYRIRTGVEELWDGKGRMLLIGSAGVILLLLAALLWRSGAVLWKSGKGQAATTPVAASATKAPEVAASSSPADLGRAQPVSANIAAQPSSTKTPAKEPTKPQEQSAAAKTPSKEQPKPPEQNLAAKTQAKPAPVTQASASAPEVLRPPAQPPAAAPAVTSKKEEAPPAAEPPGAVPGGVPNGVPSSVANVLKETPAVPKMASQRVGISSGVAQGLLIHQVTPQYPAPARQAHIQGTVVLQVVIGKDGSVQGLTVVSGHPMLTQAALDAVRRWRYKPYRLNGEPVEAATQINVNFTLAGQ